VENESSPSRSGITTGVELTEPSPNVRRPRSSTQCYATNHAKRHLPHEGQAILLFLLLE
jgi:hypothetical protein